MTHSKSVPEPAYLRIPHFAVWADMSVPTVHRLCRIGLLRKVRIGGASYICMASARALFASGYLKSVRGGGVDDRP
jgi:hypothetical protein